MKTNIIQNIKSFIIVLALVLGVGYAYANFTAPTQAPPGCPTGSPGCDAPINVSATAQAKSGSLTIGGTTVPTSSYKLNVPDPGLAFFHGLVTDGISTQTLKVTTGAGADKILTSDTNGVATWKTLTAAIPGTYASSQAWLDIDKAAHYLDSGSYTLHVLAGNSAAFQIITGASAPSGSIWRDENNNSFNTNNTLAGLVCSPGWTISGCWVSGFATSDVDSIPYPNGCVTNDFRSYGRQAELTISCVASY
jgi:hypothetical protein